MLKLKYPLYLGLYNKKTGGKFKMIKPLEYYINKGISPTLATKYLNELFVEQMESPLSVKEVKEAMDYISTK